MKKHKKHVRKWHLGRPVKPKVQRRPTAGRPPIHPPEDCRRTMVRSTEPEQSQWRAAAAAEAGSLGLPENKLSIGPWARRALNAAAGRILGTAIETGVSRISEPEDLDDPLGLHSMVEGNR